jgi:hypothetical protein
MKFGKTIVKLQDLSSKKSSNNRVPEPRLKVRRLQSERRDDLNLELSSDKSNTICSPLQSAPLVDESTQVTQQVSQLGVPSENLSAYTVAPSNHMYIAGNVGALPSSQQQFGSTVVVTKPSLVGQLVGNISANTETQFLGTVQPIHSVGTPTASTSSSVLAPSLNELSGISSPYVMTSSSMDSALPVMLQQPTQSTVKQSQVYIPNTIYGLSGEQVGLTAGTLTPVNALENQKSFFSPLLQALLGETVQTHHDQQLHLQKQTPQQQSSQQGQAKQHQQYTLLKNGETSVPAFTGFIEAKSQEEILTSVLNATLPSDNAQLKGPPDVLITTPSSVILPQQQNVFPVNSSPNLNGKIGIKTSLLQLPAVEARGTAVVSLAGQANSHNIYVPNAVQNSSSIGANQQAVDVEGHLSSRYDIKNI